MKEIILAEHSGFCFGVKRAIEKTEERLREAEGGEIYTFGPLIHNKAVTDDLEQRGAKIINSLDDCAPGDVVIVRSHGETKEFFIRAKEKGLIIEDATCPFVETIHKLVEEAHDAGKPIVIIGDKEHPEVVGVNGWCENSAIIINSEEEAKKALGILPERDIFIVCQTTIRLELMEAILKIFTHAGKAFEIKNTICSATSKRQKSCRELAEKCDAMVIIGGKDSSNSKKLYEISKKICQNTYFIEKKEDLWLHQLEKCNKIGVAAGASTPERIIKEVIATMSENNTEMKMEDFMDEIEQSLRLPKLHEIVNGTVHQVTEKEVIVNMGCKKDGVIPKEEVTLEENQKLTDLFKVGDEIQAKVVKTDDGDGVITLSKKKLEVNAHWGEILEALENNTILTVKVLRPVNGGVIAAYKEVTGFIPLSQLSDRYVESADEFIGQELTVRVSRVDQKRNRVVFSHRAIIAEEKQARVEAAWERLNVDDIVPGKVMRFTEYGAFIDLDGVDGLLHISEISWGKLKHPQEVLKIGDVVNVKILAMNAEKGKISLGLKQTTPEPWSVIEDKYHIGEIVTGTVVQIKEYGAFLELEPGLDGLVHISEVAHKRIDNIGSELTIGQTVSAKVLDIDTEKKRISLSIRQTMEAPENDDAFDDVDEDVEDATETVEE